MQKPKTINFSTFIITIISLITIFIISLLCVIISYEKKLENQVTDLTFIPDNTGSEENLTIIE